MRVIFTRVGAGAKGEKGKSRIGSFELWKSQSRPYPATGSDIECLFDCTCEMINFSRVELGVRRVRRGVPDALEGLGGKWRED